MSKCEVIFELADEIRALEDTISYLRVRVLRKRLAMEEVWESFQVNREQAPKAVELPEAALSPDLAPETASVEPEPVSEVERFNCSAIVRKAINGMDGSTFHYEEVALKARELRPQEDHRYFKRISYSVVGAMLREGLLHRVPGGFARVIAPVLTDVP